MSEAGDEIETSIVGPWDVTCFEGKEGADVIARDGEGAGGDVV